MLSSIYRPRWTRPLAATALVAGLVVIFGVIPSADAGITTTFTRCMKGGELSSVRRGDTPIRPCEKPTHQIPWNSTEKTDARVTHWVPTWRK